ncbi:hypothetical protein [Aureispira sp. CCB-E]|uniref:hypothetical protein n=1 Tax=Aureispira sp. CCB-E TaxID=3051121 RepID=UPI0028687528|nr:hypothetical protein [Aureispira sp. CCB-E]WMX13177.1 hypothetical protein QP953_20245 [Aureispira sp. CCB-E]
MKDKTCSYCKKGLKGRRDKKFCSLKCKNTFNYELRRDTKTITKTIDAILHRNYEILRMLMSEGKKKIYYNRLVLEQIGFQFNYHTSTYVNSKKKIYYYVYDFAWMEFTTREILIVKK